MLTRVDTEVEVTLVSPGRASRAAATSVRSWDLTWADARWASTLLAQLSRPRAAKTASSTGTELLASAVVWVSKTEATACDRNQAWASTSSAVAKPTTATATRKNLAAVALCSSRGSSGRNGHSAAARAGASTAPDGLG